MQLLLSLTENKLFLMLSISTAHHPTINYNHILITSPWANFQLPPILPGDVLNHSWHLLNWNQWHEHQTLLFTQLLPEKTDRSTTNILSNQKFSLIFLKVLWWIGCKRNNAAVVIYMQLQPTSKVSCTYNS